MHGERIAEFLGVFVEVAREGSFSGAARRLGVAPSSIARQIDMLESQLGAPVFRRSTRLVSLTEAGAALHARARRVLDELADAQQEIAALGGGITGVLRVACFPTFGKRYVIPVVATLAARHPHLRIDLDLTERLADPVAERLDAVIRIGALPDSALIASPLSVQVRVLCASPAYLAQAGTPTDASQLPAHRLLDKLHGADLLGWRHVIERPVAPGKAAFCCDDFEALREAALAGMGIALLPDWVVGPDLACGTLAPVLPALSDAPAMHADIHLLRAPVDPAAKLQAFTSALKSFIGSPPRWRAAHDLDPASSET